MNTCLTGSRRAPGVSRGPRRVAAVDEDTSLDTVDASRPRQRSAPVPWRWIMVATAAAVVGQREEQRDREGLILVVVEYDASAPAVSGGREVDEVAVELPGEMEPLAGEVEEAQPVGAAAFGGRREPPGSHL